MSKGGATRQAPAGRKANPLKYHITGLKVNDYAADEALVTRG